MTRALSLLVLAACSTTPTAPLSQAAPPTQAQVDWLAGTLDVAPYNFLTLADAAPFDDRVSTLEASDAATQTAIADLTARLTAAEAAMGAGALTAGSFDAATIAPGGVVSLAEIITLTASSDVLDVDQIHVNGGGFIGGPGIELELGSDTTYTNVHFEDVELDGRDITFVNCSFSGAIAFPSDANVVGGSMNNVVQATVRKLDSVVGTEIDNSSLVRVGRIANADIDNSTLGGDVVNSNALDRVTGSTLGDCLIYPGRGATISGNELDDSTILAGPAHFGSLTIAGNTFNGVYGSEIASIYIDASSSWYAQITVTGNSFMGNSTVPSHVTIVGNATGNYQGISISANVFMRGTVAVDAQSNIPTFVHGNAMLGTTQNLGMPSVHVSGNHTF